MNALKEIQETLKECKDAIPHYELSSDGGDDNNEGWIEALEYVVHLLKKG
jgi:hypothetical protein